jgi:hypothetical protein
MHDDVQGLQGPIENMSGQIRHIGFFVGKFLPTLGVVLVER